MRDGALPGHTVAAPEQFRGRPRQPASPVLDEFATLDPTGNATKAVIVNALGDGFEFVDPVDVSGYAPLASPAFTGAPTAPTAAPGTNTTQLSTTAFVAAAITSLINSAPGVLDTLDELAAALGDDANFAATMATALAGKQPLDTQLTDFAALAYAGNALKVLRVNAGATGLEFAAGGGGGGTTITSGITTIDFGAFPGSSDAKLTITGQAGILAGSTVKAYIIATATADHTADEHWVETIEVKAGNIVPGTGFDIYAKNTNTLSEPVLEQWANTRLAGPGTGIKQVRPNLGGGNAPRLYGQFTVAWEWF